VFLNKKIQKYLVFGVLSLNFFASEFSKIKSDTINPEELENKLLNKGQQNRRYLVSAGDVLLIEFIGITEFSGNYPVGPDGMLLMPEIREVFVMDMTINEIHNLLKIRYAKYLKEPDFYIKIMKYRPVKVFVKGEVKRPGFYTLLGTSESGGIGKTTVQYDDSLEILPKDIEPLTYSNFSALNFPTLFSAIKASQGITPYSDLSKVRVIRKESISNGGGLIYSDVNFLSFIKEANYDQNIRIFDGDIIEIPKSEKLLTEQLIEATNSNLNPANLIVYVGGNVEIPGETIVPQGSSLNHAIASSGGRGDLSGKIEFYRLTNNGDMQRRIFDYSKSSKIGAYDNPLLVNGDIIKVNNSNFKKFTNVFGEITQPFLGVYSVYKIFGLGD